MGMTMTQLFSSDKEVDQLIINCVMKRSLFKPDIISAAAFDFFRKNKYYQATDTYNEATQSVIEGFVKTRFFGLQRRGKLKFKKKESKWVVILNAEFPTLREDYV